MFLIFPLLHCTQVYVKRVFTYMHVSVKIIHGVDIYLSLRVEGRGGGVVGVVGNRVHQDEVCRALFPRSQHGQV